MVRFRVIPEYTALEFMVLIRVVLVHSAILDHWKGGLVLTRKHMKTIRVGLYHQSRHADCPQQPSS